MLGSFVCAEDPGVQKTDREVRQMEERFLEISDLKKSFGSGEARQEVLRGMDFTVKKGEFCV